MGLTNLQLLKLRLQHVKLLVGTRLLLGHEGSQFGSSSSLGHSSDWRSQDVLENTRLAHPASRCSASEDLDINVRVSEFRLQARSWSFHAPLC